MTIYQAFFGGTFDKYIHSGHYFSIMTAQIHPQILLFTDPMFQHLNFNPLEDRVQLSLFVGANKSVDYDGKETVLSMDDRIKNLSTIFENLKLIPLSGDYPTDLQMRFNLFESLQSAIVMYFGPYQKEKQWAVNLRMDIIKRFPDAHFYCIIEEYEPTVMRSSIFDPSKLTLEEMTLLVKNASKKITEQNYLYDRVVEKIED